MKQVTVGSSKNCDVNIANDYVSRIHCKIIYDGEEVWVKDMKSSNGTYVDGKRVGYNDNVKAPRGAEVSLAKEVTLSWDEIQSFRPSRSVDTSPDRKERDPWSKPDRGSQRKSEGERSPRTPAGEDRSEKARDGMSQGPDEREPNLSTPSPGNQSGGQKNQSAGGEKPGKRTGKGSLPLEFRPSWWNYAIHILFFWLIIPLVIAIWQRMSVVLRVTKKKVVLERGVLSKEKKEVFISDIRTMDVKKSFLQRMFGVGDVMIATAGTGDYEDVVSGLPNPEKVKEVVTKQRSDV
jgi:pSer/pThr/pTyr-binding forkhead associated (FHA) protein